MESITNESLPVAFRQADRVSIDAQRRYLRLVKLELILMVTAAAVSAVVIAEDEVRDHLNIAVAIIFGIGVALTKLMLDSRDDKIWFSARSLAESIKTIAWRYATAAEPYEITFPNAEADRKFCESFGSLLTQQKNVAQQMVNLEPDAELITEPMRRLRRSNLVTRKETYIRDRIKEQRVWYSGKAASNATAAKRWLVIVAAIQAGGLIAAILVATSNITIPYDVASVVAAMAAAILAWLPIKQHRSLATSYAMAAYELAAVETRAEHITEEDKFAEFIADAENAISREHTMWGARQDMS